MVKATALINMELRSSSMTSPPYKFHPNPQNGSKVIKGFLCTHFGSLNVHHFEMAKVITRLRK
jgi:hypothetical protein